MKKLLIALLATGIAGQAFAQPQSAQPTQPQPQSNQQAAAPTVPGAADASATSQGNMTAVYIGAGVAALAIVAVGSSGGGHGNQSTPAGGSGGTTGTTGTH